METLRRSARLTHRPIYTDDVLESSYPEGAPKNDFESTIALLNQQSFPANIYAHIDDILVYALFATKRRSHSYRAFHPTPALQQATTQPLSADDGIRILQTYRQHVPETLRGQRQAIQNAVEALIKQFPSVFLEEHHSVTEQ